MPRRRTILCIDCGKRHAKAVTCEQHRETLNSPSRAQPQCHLCRRRHNARMTCDQHSSCLRTLSLSRPTRSLQPCTVCGARHPAATLCAEHAEHLAARAALRSSRAHAVCTVCSTRHPSTITCESHQAVLARRCRSRVGVLRDDERCPPARDIHFDADELRARAKRDPSPIPATRIRDMFRAAHDYLHAYVATRKPLSGPTVQAHCVP